MLSFLEEQGSELLLSRRVGCFCLQSASRSLDTQKRRTS